MLNKAKFQAHSYNLVIVSPRPLKMSWGLICLSSPIAGKRPGEQKSIFHTFSPICSNSNGTKNTSGTDLNLTKKK
jgi:hypothetical protein